MNAAEAQRVVACPPEPSPLVGRAEELLLVDACCRAHRLVTLAGAPGVGKTRLALRYARTDETSRRFDGGVFFCALAGASHADDLIAVVGRALGLDEDALREHDGRAVARALSGRGRALVILDNAEHLASEVAHFAPEWLEAAPAVHVVVTSREPLGLPREKVLPVAPLASGPDGGAALDLLMDRVTFLRGSRRPEAAERADLAGIAAALLGMPVALELAGALLQAGEARDVLAVLAPRRRRLPSANPLPRPAVDQVWPLLAAGDREVLAQCSIFRGSFTAEAAQRVVRLPFNTPVAEVLRSLHRRFLLRREPAVPERFSMCEALATHAGEMLHLAGEADATAWRHAHHYLELAEPLVSSFGPPDEALVARLHRERDDLRAVLEFGHAMARSDMVLRAAVALDTVSRGRGLTPLELRRLDAALAGERMGTESHLFGRALAVRSKARRCLGRLEEAERDAVAALALAEHYGDTRQSVATQAALGEVLFQLGRLDEAAARYQALLPLARAAGDRAAEIAATLSLGAVHQSAGRAAQALAHYQRTLELAVAAHDGPAECRAAMSLGSYWLERGDHGVAQVYYERGRFLAESLELRRSQSIVTAYLGVLHFDAGRLREAEHWLGEAVALARAVGDVRVEGIFEGIRGAVLAGQGRVAEGEAALDLAERLLDENPFFRDVVAIHRGHVDVAIGLADQARARIDAAVAGGLAACSDDARIAIRILERALAGPARR